MIIAAGVRRPLYRLRSRIGNGADGCGSAPAPNDAGDRAYLEATGSL